MTGHPNRYSPPCPPPSTVCNMRVTRLFVITRTKRCTGSTWTTSECYVILIIKVLLMTEARSLSYPPVSGACRGQRVCQRVLQELREQKAILWMDKPVGRTGWGNSRKQGSNNLGDVELTVTRPRTTGRFVLLFTILRRRISEQPQNQTVRRKKERKKDR